MGFSIIFTGSYPLFYNLGMGWKLVGIREAVEFLGVTPLDVASRGCTKGGGCRMSEQQAVIGVMIWRGYGPNNFITSRRREKPAPARW